MRATSSRQPVGLRDVVVGADLEHQDHVDLFALCAHDDDGHVAREPDVTAHVKSRFLRQHEIEEDNVEVAFFEERETLLTVGRGRDCEAFALQPDSEGVDKGFFVFDDKNADAWFAGWTFCH